MMNSTAAPSVPDSRTSLPDVLKTSTAALHLEAESHPFQKALASGQLTREAYVAYLEQMRHVHRILEASLRELMPVQPRLEGIISEEQFQESNLESDLAWFDRDHTASTPVRPGPSAAAYEQTVSALPAERRLALLGHHYVLEGSKNGAKYIARAVRAAYGMTPGTGDRFLDPYGSEQRTKWMRFRESLARAEFTADERGDILAGASDMFRMVISLSTELAGETAKA